MTRWAYMPTKQKKQVEDLPYIDRVNLERGIALPQKETKYHSHKVEVNGIMFDSKKEARRYKELRSLEEMGLITDLELQKKFVLIPTQREDDIIGPRGGVKKGKAVEKECAYYADFYYFDTEKGKWIVEDTKSPATRTEAYKIKRKLMRYVHGLEIQEI